MQLRQNRSWLLKRGLGEEITVLLKEEEHCGEQSRFLMKGDKLGIDLVGVVNAGFQTETKKK